MSRVLPILFNTEMVRAILDGRKTVTRRIMKPQPLFYTGRKYIFADDVCPKKWECCDNIIETYQYQPGDILYVRETWSPVFVVPRRYLYKVGCEEADNLPIKWRPSIHMPKEAARIWLKVTDVRVEQLKDITVQGVQKEGLLPDGYISQYAILTEDFFLKYKTLWDSTIKKSDLDRYGWNANPWVWVIEFEQCEKPENKIL